MKFSILALVLSFVSLSAAHAASNTNCGDEEHYPLITKSELKQVAEKKSAVIVDVNGDESFEKAHVPGAINYASHEKDFASTLPAQKDALIVAYCGGPMCTAWKKAAQKACEMGYTNIRHFKPGISGWLSQK